MDFEDTEHFTEQIIEICKMVYNDEGINQAFKSYDKDSNCYLDKKEMSKVVNEVLEGYPKVFTKAERRDITNKWFQKFDTNKDGKISIDEFKNMMETVFAKVFIEELADLQKKPNCPEALKDLDLIKQLNDKLSTLSKDDQEIIKKFIENSKKEIWDY